ncbi:MAG: MBL fold metallo-hydrolase [Sphaerochaetaceae bacterium]|nr:MBL fold metallo-hydrolase [Spirochaetales bacterium]MDY5499934.1 MBL fold metallo-hydrolase [Sphaerochaetaceae bacterium]
MDEMTITYYGHSCFQVSFRGRSVLFDPYQRESVPGLELPEGIEVDACYCSHAHADHNARNLVKVTGSRDPFPVTRMEVPHDGVGGQKRGMSQVTLITCGNVTLAHLGDYGRLPTPSEYEVLCRAQVLFVPCGGFFTIGPQQAKELIKKVGAPLSILMHFRTGKQDYDVLSDISQIREIFGGIDERGESSMTFTKDTIPEGVVTLQPLLQRR